MNMRVASRDPQWWDEPAEVSATYQLLVRASVLDPEQHTEFMAKPWHWSRERESCRELEDIMARRGVDAIAGWEMTMAEMASRSVRA